VREPSHDLPAPSNRHRRTREQAPFAIEAAGLKKGFGSTLAVDRIDLRVDAGSVYAVLGPNGAGKTTLVRLLATLITPDQGSARVLSYDLVREADAIRRRVSLTGQLASVDEDLTGHENLVLLARLLGLRGDHARARCRELLGAFGLGAAARRQVKSYSGGMRRRLDLAASLIVIPELLFLDEPTTGLDPRSRNQVWEVIRGVVSAGATVLLTTQYLDEADQLADRIAVVDHGRVIAEGTSGELKASVGLGSVRLRLLDASDQPEAQRRLTRLLGVAVRVDTDPSALSAQLPADEHGGPASQRVAAALIELTRSGISVAEFALGQPSLDEVFLTLTGRPPEDPRPAQEDAS
jgi:ABC-2 type transport system ATP-binding protein